MSFLGTGDGRPVANRVTDVPTLHLVFPACSTAVRRALVQVLAALPQDGLSDNTRSGVELVLAEVLNNIVEHAYGPDTPGVIELEMTAKDDGVWFRTYDDGIEMPVIPDGSPPEVHGPLDQLPEGGFGWFLIRDLTRGLVYHRHAMRNELQFCIPSEPSLPENPPPRYGE